MNNDLKTTVLGFISGLFGILLALGVHIPGILQSQAVEGIIASTAVVALGYYTNKRKSAAPGTTLADDPMKKVGG